MKEMNKLNNEINADEGIKKEMNKRRNGSLMEELEWGKKKKWRNEYEK